MATDHEVTEEIRKYLDGADLEQVTQKTVRKHLAARFPGLDVSARKDFIKEQVVALLSPPAEPAAGHSKAGASSAATSRNGSSSAAAAAADEDEPTDIGKSDRSCKQVVPRHLQGAQSKSKKRKVCGEDGGVAGWRGGDAMGGCCVVGPGEFAPCRTLAPPTSGCNFCIGCSAVLSTAAAGCETKPGCRSPPATPPLIRRCPRRLTAASLRFVLGACKSVVLLLAAAQLADGRASADALCFLLFRQAPAKKARGGYQKPVELSQPMAEFMGAPSMSRSEVCCRLGMVVAALHTHAIPVLTAQLPPCGQTLNKTRIAGGAEDVGVHQGK